MLKCFFKVADKSKNFFSYEMVKEETRKKSNHSSITILLCITVLRIYIFKNTILLFKSDTQREGEQKRVKEMQKRTNERMLLQSSAVCVDKRRN